MIEPLHVFEPGFNMDKYGMQNLLALQQTIVGKMKSINRLVPILYTW